MSHSAHLPGTDALDALDALDACGCCETTPVRDDVANPPGLSALDYRAGTHGSFLRRMLARLPLHVIRSGENEGVRPLQALTTRAPDDASIALLDAWATVGDVLTFYQERHANEGFLGTAVERRSVLELARAIGYELSPGVAASAFLAFTVEAPRVAAAAAVPPEQRGLLDAAASNPPLPAVVPAGTQVKSVPGPGERPQTFETTAELQARAEWNAIRPRLTQPQPPDPASRSVWVDGMVSDVRAGGWVLFVTHDAGGAVSAMPRQVLAITAEPPRAAAASGEEPQQVTRIDLAGAAAATGFTPPLKSALTFQLPTLQGFMLNKTAADSLVLGQAWKQKDLTAFLGIQAWKPKVLAAYASALRRRRPPPPKPSFELDTPEPGLHAFTVRSSPFGHNAPRHRSLPADQRTGTDPLYPKNWDQAPPSIAHDSQGVAYVAGGSSGGPAAHFFFERVVPEVLPASWVLIESGAGQKVVRVGAVQEASLADFALSGRATGAYVARPDGSELDAEELDAFAFRTTALHAGSRPLALSQLPIEQPIGAGTAEASQLTLDGLVLDLEPGRLLALTGERADLPGVMEHEVVRLSEAIHADGFTTLFFDSGLRHPYLRETVTLNANVVEATHGESVTEVLGSGDGAIPNQRFTLKKPPLTHVAAASGAGTRSTLELRVNELLWEQAPSLYRVGPGRRAYTVRIGDDGAADVIFGDGEDGARPPTGVENIIGRYRTGIGLEAEVDAHALTVLQSRPLGIRNVTNPLPATGAADPEPRDAARSNAPLAVRTLGRIVSLRDYADFARGFAGIGKAEARALWDGYATVVSVTIASASGEPVPETSSLFRNLRRAMAGARAELDSFRITSYQPVYFEVDARVLVDPAHEPDTVLAHVEAALLHAFGFAHRRFAQGVTASEVIATVHRVDGVSAVDLDALHLVTEPAPPATPATAIRARPARWEDGDIAPAELLLISPAGISIREMET
jgi:predicted phage baseplate assembly protein